MPRHLFFGRPKTLPDIDTQGVQIVETPMGGCNSTTCRPSPRS